MESFYVSYVCVIIFCMNLTPTTGQSRGQIESLYTSIMTGYNMYVRPDIDQSKATEVKLNLKLIDLKGLDEVQGVMTTVVQLDVLWQDPRMMFVPGSNGGASSISFPQKIVWKPPLSLLNAVTDTEPLGFDDVVIPYNALGAAKWQVGETFETNCDIDVSKFPYDSHECKISMIGYSTSEIKLSKSGDGISLDMYDKSNGQWLVTDAKTTTSSPGSQISLMTFTLTLKRIPDYFVLNVFIPLMIMAFLNVMVFVLPADSGERVGYSITCLLAMAVFLTLVGDNLPKTSKPMAQITYYLIAYLGMSTISCILTVVGLILYNKDESSKVPGCIQALIRCLRCKTCKRKDRSVEPEYPKSPSDKKRATETPCCFVY
ncbi:LOW QUALITY PROTEIN: hypothetical protein KUTeg_005214 [Tegillarca granosa]|uniref:Uncharacterized protein n=1 Tax=Tegillarca granosa TaxID=220873 RepID=A0ABQ9FNM0_TEGGR|nr:LOW QUALITY PROTEIN: hypothetical protein KUTeg_005214 [Tegillarca granosa]